MVRLFSTRLTILLLAIFIANSCIGNLRPDWLAHEIAHYTQRVPMTLINFQETSQVAEQGVVGEKGMANTIEHRLLHVADHLQLVAIIFSNSNFLFLPGVVLFYFVAIAMGQTSYNAPFRPPRPSLFSIPLM